MWEGQDVQLVDFFLWKINNTHWFFFRRYSMSHCLLGERFFIHSQILSPGYLIYYMTMLFCSKFSGLHSTLQRQNSVECWINKKQSTTDVSAFPFFFLYCLCLVRQYRSQDFAHAEGVLLDCFLPMCSHYTQLIGFLCFCI